MHSIMRPELENRLREIKKYYQGRTSISFKYKNVMKKENNTDLVSKLEAQEMIEKALRRHNRRSTIISSILGWILIGGYSFGLFHVVQNT